MAEIKIQHKERKTPWWPWLLLLIPIIWFAMRNRGDDNDAARDTTSVGAMNGTTGAGATIGPDSTAGTTSAGAAGATGTAGGDAVGAYTSFIAATDANRDEAGQHQYTAEGIRRLAAAIESRGTATTASQQTTIMRAMADSLGQTPTGDDRHADMARGAFDSALGAMRGMGMTGLEGADAAARALKPNKHLLEQKDEIQRFFDAARTALQSGGTTPR